jgi:hypothetical protein
MSFENPLNKIPAKKPLAANDHFEYGQPVQLTREELEAGGDPYRDSEGRETAVSADGFLNRNFGKHRRAEREETTHTEAASEATPFDESQFVRRGKSPEAEIASIEDFEQQLAEQEMLAQQNEQPSAESRTRWQEQAEEPNPDKPYFTQLIEYFTASGFPNPEAEALDELKQNIDPNITDPRQRGEVAASFLKEHREWHSKQEAKTEK